jgi:hypothetical protein
MRAFPACISVVLLFSASQASADVVKPVCDVDREIYPTAPPAAYFDLLYFYRGSGAFVTRSSDPDRPCQCAAKSQRAVSKCWSAYALSKLQAIV